MVRATYFSHLPHAARKRLGCRYSRQGLSRSLKAAAARGFAIQAIDPDCLTSMLALICAGTARLVDALNKFTRGFGSGGFGFIRH